MPGGGPLLEVLCWRSFAVPGEGPLLCQEEVLYWRSFASLRSFAMPGGVPLLEVFCCSLPRFPVLNIEWLCAH